MGNASKVSSPRPLTIRTILSLLFAIAILALAFRTLGVNVGSTWSLIVSADFGLLALAFLAYYLTFPIRAFRWRYILSKVGTNVRFVNAAEILFLSWFVNCVVPAKLGDLYRAYLLKVTEHASGSRTVGTIFIERIADVVVIFILAVGAGLWSFRNAEVDAAVQLLFAIGAALALLLVTLVIVLRTWGSNLSRWLPTRLGKFWDRFHEGSTSAITWRTLPVLAFTTSTIWLLEGTRLYLVIRALGIPAVNLGFPASVFVALAAALLTAIPLTPAGIGFVEAGIAGALLIYGVAGGDAGAVALTDRAISIGTVIILGGLLYVSSAKVRRAHGLSAFRPSSIAARSASENRGVTSLTQESRRTGPSE